MVAHINTVAFIGIDAKRVDVQVQVTGGLPAFTVVGLPDKAVTEARERIRAALAAIGLALPPKRITVNLSPADMPKEGSHFDLPIALGLLVAMDVIDEDAVGPSIVIGELGLDGGLHPVSGAIIAGLHAVEAEAALICPVLCGPEAAWAGAEVIAAPDLLALLNHLKGIQILGAPQAVLAEAQGPQPDLSEIKGQEVAKRALEIAAAGGHNLLMIGPPGSGKSMLAARLPGILPPPSAREALEISMIRSVAGAAEGGTISRSRPFSTPHHSASMPALVGGGTRVRPGAVSLAHTGVLFLDELPEFTRVALEALRQPMESGRVTIARAAHHVTYPARFQLVAAMNPCRCGYLGDAAMACNRAPKCGIDYQGKISGPMFDRIDLHVDVPAVSARDLTLPPAAESSSQVAARVAAARDIQRQRYADVAGGPLNANAEADGAVLEAVATPDKEGQKLLTGAVDSMRLTARGYHRVLRVARTLADLEGADKVARPHIAEALSYRRLAPQNF